MPDFDLDAALTPAWECHPVLPLKGVERGYRRIVIFQFKFCYHGVTVGGHSITKGLPLGVTGGQVEQIAFALANCYLNTLNGDRIAPPISPLYLLETLCMAFGGNGGVGLHQAEDDVIGRVLNLSPYA